MPSFAYSAVNTAGKTISGQVETSTKAEAYRRLQRDGLTPMRVNVLTVGAASAANTAAGPLSAREKEKIDVLSGVGPRLKKAQLILFTEEIADLLEAGLQLDQALRVISERQADPVLRRIGERLRVQLRDGTDFSKALKNASPTFDSLYTNMVAAGEAGGSLPPILRRLATTIQQMNDLNNKVVSAMIYPMFMIGACILLMVVFMTVLVPQLTELLKKSGQKLPVVTDLLIQTSKFVQQTWWMFLLGLLIAFFSFRGYVATPKGRLWWDRVKLGLPLFGPVLATRLYAQLCQGMANLVHNGIPLLNGLRLMSRATPNVYLQEVLTDAGKEVDDGVSLSNALRRSHQFPELMLDIIAVGEQTGRIGHSLEKAGVRYDKELDKRIKRLTGLISPIVLIFMAIVVTIVAYAIVSAIFQSVSSVRTRT